MEPNRSAGAQTEGGTADFVSRTDAGADTRPARNPVRPLAGLRLLVRERLRLHGAPLPEGFQLPEGVTLDDLLKPGGTL